MKRRKVLKELNISVSTLDRYMRMGKLRGVKLENGYYDYDEESIMEFKNGGRKRNTAIYCRATPRQNANHIINEKNDKLSEQRRIISSYLSSINELDVQHTSYYEEIAGSYYLSDTSKMQQLIVDIMNNRIKTVYALSFNRIPYAVISLFQTICAYHNVNIEFIDTKSNYGDISEEEQQLEYQQLEELYRYEQIYNKGWNDNDSTNY
jgi:predicted site-specific integrase-resolvase